jgi:hypothetical protein
MPVYAVRVFYVQRDRRSTLLTRYVHGPAAAFEFYKDRALPAARQVPSSFFSQHTLRTVARLRPTANTPLLAWLQLENPTAQRG